MSYRHVPRLATARRAAATSEKAPARGPSFRLIRCQPGCASHGQRGTRPRSRVESAPRCWQRPLPEYARWPAPRWPAGCAHRSRARQAQVAGTGSRPNLATGPPLTLALGEGWPRGRGRFAAPHAGKPTNMPLYGYPTCGWATSASLATAVKAHQACSPTCAGELELIKDWDLPPARSAAPARRPGARVESVGPRRKRPPEPTWSSRRRAHSRSASIKRPDEWLLSGLDPSCGDRLNTPGGQTVRRPPLPSPARPAFDLGLGGGSEPWAHGARARTRRCSCPSWMPDAR